VRAAVYVVMHLVLVLRPSVSRTKVGVNHKFPSGKINYSVMEGRQIKSVKTKMRERKLRCVVNRQRALGLKRHKINGRKRNSGFYCYRTIKRHVDLFYQVKY